MCRTSKQWHLIRPSSTWHGNHSRWRCVSIVGSKIKYKVTTNNDLRLIPTFQWPDQQFCPKSWIQCATEPTKYKYFQFRQRAGRSRTRPKTSIDCIQRCIFYFTFKMASSLPSMLTQRFDLTERVLLYGRSRPFCGVLSTSIVPTAVVNADSTTSLATLSPNSSKFLASPDSAGFGWMFSKLGSFTARHAP